MRKWREDMEEKYLSLKEASEICEYSQEYLSLRARQGKLKAVKMGRNWVTKKEWVEEYTEKVYKSSIIDLSNISNEIKIPTIRFGFLFSFAFILLLSTLLFFGKNSYGEVSYKTLNYVKTSINGELSENEKFSKLDIEEKKELKKSYNFQKPEETIKDFFSSFSTVTSSSVSGSKKLLFSVFKKIDNIVFEFGRSGDFLIFKTADSFSSAFSEAKYFLKKTESSGKKIARNFTGGIYYMGEDISDSANKFFLGIKKTSSNISRNTWNIFYSSFDGVNIFVSSFSNELKNIKGYVFSAGEKISSGTKNVTLSALKGGVSVSESLNRSAKSLVKGAGYAKEQTIETTINIGKNITRSFSATGASASGSLKGGTKFLLGKADFLGQGIETFVRDIAGGIKKIVKAIIYPFEAGYKYIANLPQKLIKRELAIFEIERELLELEIESIKKEIKEIAYISKGTETTNQKSIKQEGMVVVPISEKEKTEQQIKDSFSDEVIVESKNKSSGVIKPVFKRDTSQEYFYLLVPINTIQ